MSHKVELRLGDASETLNKLIESGEQNSFDFVFIDADKQNMMNYYEKCLILVRVGGLIAIDNMLWVSHRNRVAHKYNANTHTSSKIITIK